MNTEELKKKLLAAARANPPGDHVPLAFEKRILANLAAKPVADLAALWARALWRAAVPCVAVTVLLPLERRVRNRKPVRTLGKGLAGIAPQVRERQQADGFIAQCEAAPDTRGVGDRVQSPLARAVHVQ